jgi:hypothetical protein
MREVLINREEDDAGERVRDEQHHEHREDPGRLVNKLKPMPAMARRSALRINPETQ